MDFDDQRPARRRPTTPTPPTLLAGRFVDTATALTDSLRVLVEDASDRDLYGPVVWDRKRDGTGWVYPQAEDRAFIARAGSEWVVLLWL
jgi:hypothetical protein